MIYKLFTLVFVIFFINTVLAQPNNPDLESSESILATERILDQEIVRLNNRLTNHSRLMKIKVKILPQKTIFYKGVAQGNKCVLAQDQEAQENNCIHVEVYDFIGSELGLSNKALGPKNKTMIITFAGEPSNEVEPAKVPPRPLQSIFSRIYVEEFRNNSKVISEITDEAPGTNPLENGNYYLFYQVDGFPFYGTEETPSDRGIGRYSLAVVNNTISNDIRNTFKKKFYIKHLDYFDKLLTKIFDFNYRDGNKNYRRNIQVLRDSLTY